jgi:hypothetical protein
VNVRWAPRDAPLPPVAAAAHGDVARALLDALLDRDDEALARLRGVAGGGWVVVTGPADELPWADGVRYLGRDDRAPALLVPTTLAPSVAIELLQAAILRRCEPGSAPIAVASSGWIPLGSARPLARHRLVAARSR